MENQYQIDKLQIAQEKEQRAVAALVEVEKNTSGTNVVFLKNNFSFKKIRHRVTEIDFKVMLAIALTRICALSGIKEKVSQSDSEDIVKMILYTHNDLTLEEIYKAFELERYSIYEEKTQHFQLFNAEYVSTILKKYKSWKLLTRKEHNINPEKEEVSTELSPEGISKIMDKAITEKYLEYLNSGTISEPITHIFDELVERGTIKLATRKESKLGKYYDEMLEKAKNELLSEFENAEGKDFTESKSISSIVQEIKSGKSPKITLLVKKYVLLEYFKKLKEKNEDHIETENQTN
ncbi:hypothetical protein [Flavobacterium mekongense]|uniref:hypothetical protein n=1 Tax=Flavobacterium mekongense TaxID=3379707 RepID=UPI003999837F